MLLLLLRTHRTRHDDFLLGNTALHIFVFILLAIQRPLSF